jgi:hypothetical protein
MIYLILQTIKRELTHSNHLFLCVNTYKILFLLFFALKLLKYNHFLIIGNL